LATNRKLKRRSQLTVIVIVLAALIGVLSINTDRATAVRADKAPATSLTQAESSLESGGGDEPGFYTSAAPSMFKIISALVIVIVAIYAGVYLLKRMMGKKYTGNRQTNILEVIETTYVAPKKSVTLLRVAEKSVLVGMSENQITVLTELDSDQTREVLASIKREPATESFGNVFKTATDKIKELGLRKTRKTALEA
jgi:flagellar biosynthetic protein FliO